MPMNGQSYHSGLRGKLIQDSQKICCFADGVMSSLKTEIWPRPSSEKDVRHAQITETVEKKKLKFSIASLDL